MRTAVYAGTFDPVTYGHLSVIARAAELFDHSWIVIAVNPGKEPLFSLNERADMLRELLAPWPSCSVTSTEGYVVTLARSLGARYLVRGVRGATDVEAEITLAELNRELAPEIETVFVPAHAELSEVSSSRLKQLARDRADLGRYCPELVAKRLRARLTPGEASHV
jgi:pantetheine-phosphate adenylyltransferase